MLPKKKKIKHSHSYSRSRVLIRRNKFIDEYIILPQAFTTMIPIRLVDEIFSSEFSGEKYFVRLGGGHDGRLETKLKVIRVGYQAENSLHKIIVFTGFMKVRETLHYGGFYVESQTFTGST
jgi:hypothetical protein